MITFLTWKWHAPGYRRTFTAEHVNVLARMVARHYARPHRFVCVTDDAAGFDDDIKVVADRADFAGLPSPAGFGFPSCYRRLRLFAPDAVEDFGERVVSLDLDCVIVRDLAPLVDRPEDFVGWQDPLYPAQLCGSMLLLRTGSRSCVWDGFDPTSSPALAKAAGFRGSDQAWISHQLAGSCARWRRADGVLSWRRDLLQGQYPLPPTARIVFFHGQHDPTSLVARRTRWVRENYG